MKPKPFLALAMVVFAVQVGAQVWFQGTVDEAVARANIEKKLVLVDFYSDG